jgi:RES domain-containing protein
LTITAFRITRAKYASSAFDGEGARQFGGRWNSPGTPMVYVSSSRSLATLELLVHLDDLATIRGSHVLIPLTFDESIVAEANTSVLQAGWDGPQIAPSTQLLGDQWVRSCASAVLKVPSVVTPGEYNYLVNPLHPDFSRIEIGTATRFEPDPRLTR